MDIGYSEKVKNIDIFKSLKEILISSSNVDKQNYDDRLKEVYNVQDQIGASEAIKSLEKRMENNIVSVKKRKRLEVKTTISGVRSEEKYINTENSIEK